MPLAACSEAVLNPLSLAYLGSGLRDYFPNFHPFPFLLINGCWERPCVAGEALNGHEVPFLGDMALPPLGVWSYPHRELKLFIARALLINF
jgi:hypothetical protein